MKAVEWAKIGLLGVGAFWLYRLVSGGNNSEKRAVTALANLYARLTGSGQTIPTGAVVLPDGRLIPVSQLNVRPVANTRSASFSFQGIVYYLNAPHDSNGNWLAETSLNS